MAVKVGWVCACVRDTFSIANSIYCYYERQKLFSVQYITSAT